METLNKPEQVTERMDGLRRRRGLILAALAVCIAALIGTGTLAYFTTEETAYNVITTGSLDMTLRDMTLNDDGEEIPFPQPDGISGVMPAQTVDKRVYVENTGSAAFYARIRLDTSVTGADGKPLDFDQYISLDLNDADWTARTEEGVVWYYYNKAITMGEATEKLFSEVRFSKDMPNAYQEARVVIDVTAQAVQSKNNTDSALTATGWAE